MNLEIFREYDIRGVVGKDYDNRFAFSLGSAFAEYLKKKAFKEPLTVTLGWDARLSSPELARNLAEGLTSRGANVLRLGLITTPMSYFSTFELPVSGGIMITGSHNPPEYNGFKVTAGQTTIFGDEIQALKDVLLKSQEASLPKSTHGTIKDHDIFPAYLEKYSKDIKLKNPVRVIVDCGNGAAGIIARKLYSRIGFDFEILFEEPDGKFPNHHPDPTVLENLKFLQKRVLETGAVAGIGFDGDADRIGVVDHQGRMLFGDELMVLISRSILASHPGTVIIGDVKCSDRLYHDIEKHGGKPLMYKTGHSLIKNKMKEMKSKFSGEMSGHVFFADRNYGYDDAVYAGARVVEILSQSGKTIPELLEGLSTAYSTPEIRIDTTEDKKREIVKTIKQQFGNGQYKFSDIDGIRISFPHGFALVRASNTQPVIVCRFESTSQNGLDAIRELVEGAVRRLL